MTMRVQVAHKFKVVSGNVTPDLILLFRFVTGGVDQDTFAGFVVQNIGVDHEGIEDKFFDLYHLVVLFNEGCKGMKMWPDGRHIENNRTLAPPFNFLG
jgi:hypothetical protein